MKKIISLLLAMIMVFSLATVAAADTIGDPSTDNTNYVSDVKTHGLTLKKIYNVVGNTDEDLFPSEKLTFTVTPGENNAEKGTDAPVVTVDDLTVTSNDQHTIYVNIPSYDTVGIYEYTIKENSGTSQGAVYSDASIAIKVLVTYNYAEKKLDSEIVLATPITGGKLDTFTNTYNVGTLTVNKTVTGNLADSNAYFNMTVTFTADDIVNSDITISGGSDASNPTTIAKGWTDTKTVNFKLRSGETLTFADIPNGVSYKVEESSVHLLGNGETVDPNSAGDEDYKVTYTNEEGTIATNTTAAVQIDNEKSTTVETGIALDSAPYFVILAVAMFGMVALVSKKRYEV